MTTRDMIQRLRNGEIFDNIMVADRLEDLMGLVDDMLGDHYVDHLDWYCDRYFELTEKLRKVAEIIAVN